MKNVLNTTETEFDIDFRMQLYYLLVVIVVSDVSDNIAVML